MSTITTTAQLEKTKLHTSKPSFFGIVRGELFKIARNWSTWIMLVLLLGVIAMSHIVRLSDPNLKKVITSNELAFLYREAQNGLGILRTFGGIFLIILVAYTIGLEYHFGTIRILLARGVGRLQLLFAKIAGVVIVASLLCVIGVVFNALMICLILAFATGNLHALQSINSQFWSTSWLYMETVLISMGVSILMAIAFAVVGRSLALGLSAAIIFFPADNIGSAFMRLGYQLTRNEFWNNITAYFLGPNLNVMPVQLIPRDVLPKDFQIYAFGFEPLVKVDGAHTLWVTLAYAVVFATVAIIVTWKRDVKE